MVIALHPAVVRTITRFCRSADVPDGEHLLMHLHVSADLEVQQPGIVTTNTEIFLEGAESSRAPRMYLSGVEVTHPSGVSKTELQGQIPRSILPDPAMCEQE